MSTISSTRLTAAETDRDQQRGPGVLPPAQPADRRVGHQDGGDAERADPQVGLGVAGGGPGRAEHAHQRAGEHQPGHRDRHRHRDREPDALHRLVGRLPLVAGAEQPGHRGRRPVRQEDEDRVAGDQDRRRDREPGQLRGAEVADDRGVGQHVDRLGDERPERRHRQPEDLPVPLRPQPHSRPLLGQTASRQRAGGRPSSLGPAETSLRVPARWSRPRSPAAQALALAHNTNRYTTRSSRRRSTSVKPARRNIDAVPV